jgi:hypothetical protein
VQQDQRIFDFLYEKAPTNIKTQWLNNLIGSPYYQRGLKKLEDMKFKVDDSVEVVRKVLTQVQNVSEVDKRLFYGAVNQMRCADNTELKSQYCTQIKSLFKSGNTTMQETGFLALQGATYMSETLKREATRETVEWLRTLNPNNAFQLHTIKSILLNWSIVEESVKRDYIDFIFDKLIKRVSSIESLRLGFEILVEVKPNYDDEYRTYFDDVYTKIEAEGNMQIKIELISGIMKLRPKEKNNVNKAFWEKIEKLSG